MNKTILTIALCLAMLIPAVAQAKKHKLTDADHVVLTMYDGSKVEGYLFEHWFRGIYYSGQQNFKLSIVPTVDSGKKEKEEYTAYDVVAIDFDKANVADAHWKTCKVAQFEHEKLMDLLQSHIYQFMSVVASDSAATIYKCQVVLNAPVGDNVTYEAVQYAVMMHGNPDVYPIVTDGKMDLDAMYHHLKSGKNAPFIRFMKNYFKIDANRAMVERDPTQFLDVYQQYLLSERP